MAGQAVRGRDQQVQVPQQDLTKQFQTVKSDVFGRMKFKIIEIKTCKQPRLWCCQIFKDINNKVLNNNISCP